MKEYIVKIGKEEFEVKIANKSDTSIEVKVNEQDYHCDIESDKIKDYNIYSILLNNKPALAVSYVRGDNLVINLNNMEYKINVYDKRLWNLKKKVQTKEKVVSREIIKSPMPGKIVRIYTKVGEIIAPKSPVVALEAMKMEMDIITEVGGRVEKLRVNLGDGIEGDTIIAIINPQVE